MVPGISTLGIKVGFNASPNSSTLPASVTQLDRINAVGGINLETEQIDASALEDYISKYIAGRADTGGSFPITVNVTDATIAEWQAVFTASAENDGVWIEIWSPYLTKAFWVFAQTPTAFPMPEIAQNELATVEIPMTIVEYHGLGTAVEPEASSIPTA